MESVESKKDKSTTNNNNNKTNLNAKRKSTALVPLLWNPEFNTTGFYIERFSNDCRNYVIAIVTLSNWLKRVAPVFGISTNEKQNPKPIAPRTRDFSRTSSELQVIARNFDWLIALPALVVIGRSNCFGFGFSTIIWKPLKSPIRSLVSVVPLNCAIVQLIQQFMMLSDSLDCKDSQTHLYY